EGVERTVAIASHHHRSVANQSRFEIAGSGHFGFEAHIVPHRTAKNLLLFEIVRRLVGIDPIRNAADSLFRPRITELLRLHRSVHLVAYPELFSPGGIGIPPDVISPSQRWVRSRRMSNWSSTRMTVWFTISSMVCGWL